MGLGWIDLVLHNHRHSVRDSKLQNCRIRFLPIREETRPIAYSRSGDGFSEFDLDCLCRLLARAWRGDSGRSLLLYGNRNPVRDRMFQHCPSQLRSAGKGRGEKVIKVCLTIAKALCRGVDC